MPDPVLDRVLDCVHPGGLLGGPRVQGSLLSLLVSPSVFDGGCMALVAGAVCVRKRQAPDARPYPVGTTCTHTHVWRC